MTLCIAWRDSENLHLASDSRITFQKELFIDVGIKTFEIPLKIFAPFNNEKETNPPILDTNIGICFAGSLSGTFIIKDTLIEFLKHLQYIPGITEVSLENICEIVRKLHENIIHSIRGVLDKKSNTHFFLTGYCPNKKRIECYKFTGDISTTTTKSTYIKILEKPGFELLGTGESKARELIDNGETNMLKVLQKVINDPYFDTVGGSLQYGFISLNEINFEIFGVQYTTKDQYGALDPKFIVRGTDYFSNIDEDSLGFHIGYKFIIPFDETPFDEI